MINKAKRYGSIFLALVIILMTFSSCNSNKEEVDDTREDTPAKVSLTAGVGRKTSEPISPTRNSYTICIDPGHGFVDGGCGEGIFDDGILEKDVTLAIAKCLERELQSLGYSTVLTHDGTTIPANADSNGNRIFSAAERAEYVNKLDIDYFVSIHVNAFDSDTSVSGVQIYYEQNANKSNTWSEEIARDISDAIQTTVPNVSRVSLKDGADYSLAVTRQTKAAASLIEVGFCTNPNDAANMADPEWQTAFAKAVAAGIDEFFGGASTK